MRKLKDNIVKIYGIRGESWLAGLSRNIEQLKDAWGLSKLKPLYALLMELMPKYY